MNKDEKNRGCAQKRNAKFQPNLAKTKKSFNTLYDARDARFL